MEDFVAEEAMNNKLVSIIIISYNGLFETTEPCLRSIFEQTDYPDYEVIVVDNCSADGTQEYLKALSAEEHRLKCIFNVENRGFAGGNNDAIKVANGRFLVLLNSDTLVQKGWLQRIVSVLAADDSIGLVGPVSNSAGNEQTIFTSGKTPEQILDEGALWAKISRGDIIPMERLCFFCVATRRDVIDKIGLLDESYGIGFYEDDDYCIRVKNAGFKLACLEDVFVYHRGSASFNKSLQNTKELLKKNKRILENKFNITYSPRHPRDRQLDLVESYINQLENGRNNYNLRCKIENRMQILNELMPRGLLKRWRFNRHLNSLNSKLNNFNSSSGNNPSF